MKKISSIILWLVAATIGFNLVYTFASVVAQSILPHGIINGLKYLSYLLLLSSLGLSLYYRLRQDSWRTIIKAPRYVVLAVAVLAWSTLSILYSEASVWQSARGLNVDFAGLILLIAIWLWRPTTQQAKTLVYTMIGTMIGFAVLAIPEAIANHAYRVWTGHDLKFHFVVQKIPQLRSLTSGPNPLGTLMVVLSGLIVWQIKDLRWRYGLLIFTGMILGLTYARSAWLGVGLMGAGIFITEARKRRFAKWPVVLALSILLGITVGAVRYHEGVINILTHGGSTDEHSETAKDALDEARNRAFKASIAGFGIGTAGPVVYGTPEEKKGNFIKITEDWYLQLIEEIGFIGLALYLWLYVAVTRQLFKNNQRILGWLALGLALNAIFLHTWSSEVNLNLIFWGVAGLALLGYNPRSATVNHEHRR